MRLKIGGALVFVGSAIVTFSLLGYKNSEQKQKHDRYMAKMSDIHDITVELREWIVAASNDPSISLDEIKKRYDEGIAFIELVVNSY